MTGSIVNFAHEQEPLWAKAIQLNPLRLYLKERMLFMVRLFCWCTIAMLFISCSTNAEPNLAFTDSNCKPPCWNGLVPGQLNEDSVRAILSGLPLVDQNSAENKEGQDYANEHWFYRILTGGESLVVRLRDNRVHFVSLQRAHADTIADIVSWLGEPESVYARYVGPEDIKLHIDLLYPSKGVVYTAKSTPLASEIGPTGKLDTGRLDPDAIIETAMFASPGSVQSMLADLGQNPIVIQCVLSNAQPWTGYGTIQVNSCP
jgi:hypothetical protein